MGTRPLGVSCGVSLEPGTGMLATGPVDSVGYGRYRVEPLWIRLVPEQVVDAQSDWDLGSLEADSRFRALCRVP